jgi:hypothetical protein
MLPTPGKSRYRTFGLARFKTEFSFLLGAGFADPDHSAAFSAGCFFIEDKFDQLAGPKLKISAQPETFLRGIKDQARLSLRFAVQIDDQACASLCHQPASTGGLWEQGTRAFSYSLVWE